MARRAKLTPKKIEYASTVRERWNYQKHSTEENILQANARLKQFVESGNESPSFKLSQEALETRLPHKVSMKVEYKKDKASFSDYTYLYPEFEGLAPIDKKDVKKSVERFLGSSQGTVKKYDKDLRQRYNTFTGNLGINRRAFTFNDYKDLFENYSYIFEKSYEDSGKLAVAVVQHIYEDRRHKDKSTKSGYQEGYETTKEWLKSLENKLNTQAGVPEEERQTIEDLATDFYNRSYETKIGKIGFSNR